LSITGQKSKKRKLISYCRVSSASQKKDLISQKQAVESFCFAAGKIVDEKLEDIGSGLNYKRKHFVQLMEMVEQ
jgi:predicted site-specific integrase-resolvase